MPKVSVLIPIFNAASYVQESIQSLLLQSFIDFEILALNDGSSDKSLEIIESIHDPRIRVISNPNNQGISKTLNRGILEAKGEYLARLDSDDLATFDRLEKQVRFLDENPEIGIVGSAYRTFGTKLSRTIDHPYSNSEIKAALLFGSPFAHPSVMIRKKTLLDHQLFYNSEYDKAEDYELWSRIAFKAKMANLPEVLLNYRVHPNQISASSASQAKVADKVRNSYLERLSIQLDDETKSIHLQISAWGFDFLKTEAGKQKYHSWFNAMINSDAIKNFIGKEAFQNHLVRRATTSAYIRYLDIPYRKAVIEQRLFDSRIVSRSQKNHFFIKAVQGKIKSLLRF
jgi:glycosyltransferase involved in cell wall biosynthesis